MLVLALMLTSSVVLMTRIALNMVLVAERTCAAGRILQCMFAFSRRPAIMAGVVIVVNFWLMVSRYHKPKQTGRVSASMPVLPATLPRTSALLPNPNNHSQKSSIPMVMSSDQIISNGTIQPCVSNNEREEITFSIPLGLVEISVKAVVPFEDESTSTVVYLVGEKKVSVTGRVKGCRNVAGRQILVSHLKLGVFELVSLINLPENTETSVRIYSKPAGNKDATKTGTRTDAPRQSPRDKQEARGEDESRGIDL
jgi:hypothetical protein